jgi:MGT family glycosyltransferase
MTNFLFTLWDGGGATPPVLDVAASLVRRGHSVRVIADPVLADEVEASGATHIHWTRGPHRTVRTPETDLVHDWTYKSPMKAFQALLDNLICGPADLFARDVQDELEREPADVLVTEMLLQGPLIAAQAARIPTATLMTTPYLLPAKGIPPFGPGLMPAKGPLGRTRDAVMTRMSKQGWKRGLAPLNAARERVGLPPLADPLDQVRGSDRILVLTSEAFDFKAAEPLPANVLYAGPRTPDPVWTGQAWTPPPGDDPLVLVGLSSTFQDQLGVLRRIAEALGRLPVRAVLTTGPVIDPADVAAPANVQVLQTAPHHEILEHAAVTITHAGHGTTLKALAHGVPLVCLPMGRDQNDNAARVVHHGAGVKLKPTAEASRIAAAVQQVLSDPSYGAAAQRLASAIASETAHDRAADELEALAPATAAC